MNRLWKAGMLLTLLAIPVLVYLFLQVFGTNYYDIPVFYEDGVNDSLPHCHSFSAPHTVPSADVIAFEKDSAFKINFRDRITAIAFLSGDCGDTCRRKFNQLLRVRGVFEDQREVALVALARGGRSDTLDAPPVPRPGDGSWQFYKIEESAADEFIGCGLIMRDEARSLHTITLVDKEGRIRGYYDALDEEEVDRLILEIRILLHNYAQTDE